MPQSATAVVLIAHGSREPEANRAVADLAELLGQRGEFAEVTAAYLEIAAPTIADAAAAAVQRGASTILLLPFFLTSGRHVREDLTTIQAELQSRFPDRRFLLAEPLTPHPLLIDILIDRIREALDGSG